MVSSFRYLHLSSIFLLFSPASDVCLRGAGHCKIWSIKRPWAIMHGTRIFMEFVLWEGSRLSWCRDWAWLPLQSILWIYHSLRRENGFLERVSWDKESSVQGILRSFWTWLGDWIWNLECWEEPMHFTSIEVVKQISLKCSVERTCWVPVTLHQIQAKQKLSPNRNTSYCRTNWRGEGGSHPWKK